jgi:alanine-glyoxylate transaminase/serine-glyoxylate transaminase/serine-pyruvate transaminase
MSALTGVEMGLKLAGIPPAGSGMSAAMEFFAATPSPGALT